MQDRGVELLLKECEISQNIFLAKTSVRKNGTAYIGLSAQKFFL